MKNKSTYMSIPLPHLGYGIKADGTAVTLTNTNVGVDYHKDGSTHMLDYGCVKREPELITNGDFSDGLNGWDNEVGDVKYIENGKLLLKNTLDAWRGVNRSFDLGEGKYRIEFDYEVTEGVFMLTIRADITNTLYVKSVSGKGRFSDVFTVPNTAENTRVIMSFNHPYTAYIDNVTLKRIDNFIPNKTDGTPLSPLITGDTQINATPNGINNSLLRVLFTEASLNKSNTLLWKPTIPIRTNPLEWDVAEILNIPSYVQSDKKKNYIVTTAVITLEASLLPIVRFSINEDNLETTWECRVIHSPTFIEKYKDDFVRSWANEDGDDIIKNPNTKSQDSVIKTYFTGDGYLINLANFCTFMALEDFEYRDTNQYKKFNASYVDVNITERNDVSKYLFADITIKNKTGRYGNI